MVTLFVCWYSIAGVCIYWESEAIPYTYVQTTEGTYSHKINTCLLVKRLTIESYPVGREPESITCEKG